MKAYENQFQNRSMDASASMFACQALLALFAELVVTLGLILPILAAWHITG